MPRIFDDITSDKPANVYAGLPVQETKALNASMSEQYQSSRNAKDALDVMANNLDVEDRNYEVKKRVIDETKAKFKDLISRGDYQNAKYLIQGVEKDIMMDNELQGALQSRKAEKAYYGTQKERFDKGEISEGDYQTSLAMTRLRNKDKIAYDPETLTTKNMFSGREATKNMSDEIATETMNTIKDWKATAKPMTIDGKTFTVQSIGGVEKVFINGKETTYNEVAGALKQHILNQDKYKDFLNQQNEFAKFNMLTNSKTGEKRDFNRQDLGYLKDDELKAIATGFTEEQIKRLESSKDVKQLAMAKEAREAQNKVDLNDPKTLEGVYDKFSRENTLNKMVYPAAEKASNVELDYKLFDDKAALENLKARNDRALKKYEYDLKNQGLPPITNTGSVQKYTGSQYEQVQKDFNNYKSDVAEKQALFNAVKDLPTNDPLRQTREKDLLDAQTTLNIAKTHQQAFYKNITPDAKANIASRVSGMFNQQEGVLSNWDYRISASALDELIKTANESKDYGLVGRLTTAKSYLSQGKDVPEDFAMELASKLTKDQYLPILNEADEERVSRPTGVAAKNSGVGESGFFKPIQDVNSQVAKSLWGTVVHHTTGATRISNIMQREYETNNNMVSANDIVTIPDLAKDNSPAAQQYHAIARSTFQNATEWSDASGETFDKLLGGKYWIKNAKGELVEAIPDMTKSQVAPAPGSNDGQTRVSVTLKDKDGVELLSGTDEDEMQRASLILKSGNPQASQMIYSTAAEYAKQNSDLKSYYRLKGDENFGKYFAPIAIGENSDPITVFYPDGSYTKIKMVADGKDASRVVYAEGAEAGKPVFKNKTFRSKDDLMQTFQIAFETPVK